MNNEQFLIYLSNKFYSAGKVNKFIQNLAHINLINARYVCTNSHVEYTLYQKMHLILTFEIFDSEHCIRHTHLSYVDSFLPRLKKTWTFCTTLYYYFMTDRDTKNLKI